MEINHFEMEIGSSQIQLEAFSQLKFRHKACMQTNLDLKLVRDQTNAKVYSSELEFNSGRKVYSVNNNLIQN